MRILITGGGGLLATSLQNTQTEHEMISLRHDELDICDEIAFYKALRSYKPDCVINCAAATDVDRCETDIGWACNINCRGPRLLAKACQDKVNFIHISTDFVFGGEKSQPYIETDKTHPINVYGATKRMGECSVLDYKGTVVRTQWLYGEGRNGFVEWLCKQAFYSRQSIRAVVNSVGSPSYAGDVAYGIIEIINRGEGGIFHVSNDGEASKYDLAKYIYEALSAPESIIPVNMHEVNWTARRPRYSVLSSERGIIMRHWTKALDEYLGKTGCIKENAAIRERSI